VGAARLRALRGGQAGDTAKPVDLKKQRRSRFLVYDGEIGAEIDNALAFFNERRKEAGETPMDWNTFVAYGLLRRGLESFNAARAEYERSQRHVLTPEEAAQEGVRVPPVLAGGGRR